jgi:hypothetical protein
MDVNSSSPEKVGESLMLRLSRIARHENLDISGARSPRMMLSALISKMHVRHGSGVVLLVDDYDAPVRERLDDPELAQANRNVLMDFYSGIKGSDRHLCFVLVTGTTRNSLIGLAGGLSHLTDLTLQEDFAGICGFTHRDLDDCFGRLMPKVLPKLKKSGCMAAGSTPEDLRRNILTWYDGYTWDGSTRILNPWSILNVFADGIFSDFWAGGAQADAAIRRLPRRRLVSFMGSGFGKLRARSLTGSSPAKPGTAPSLFQAGLLTVDTVDSAPGQADAYALRIPNWEVRIAGMEVFSSRMFSGPDTEPETLDGALREAAGGRGTRRLASFFASLFASVPAKFHPKLASGGEGFYRSAVEGHLYRTDRLMVSEPAGAKARPDLIATCPDGLLAAIEIEFGLVVNDPAKVEDKWWRKETEAERAVRARKEGRLLARLARKALDASRRKDYGPPFQAHSGQRVRIGLGVTWRGKCLALAEGPAPTVEP